MAAEKIVKRRAASLKLEAYIRKMDADEEFRDCMLRETEHARKYVE